LGSGTLSDQVLQLIVWFSLAMLALALLLIMQIVLLRFRLIARTAREQRFVATWQPLMAATIAGDSTELRRLEKGEEIFFLKLWNHLQETLRGDAKSRLNQLAARCGILQHVRTMLQKGGLRHRLIALATLGHLGDSFAWEDILRLSRERDPLLSLAAVRALFQIDSATALIDTVDELIEREDWSAPQLAILIEEVGTKSTFVLLTDAALRLADSMDQVSLARLKRLLRVLEVAPPQRVLPAIRVILFAAGDDEIIAHCLKFLHEPADLPVVRKYLSHSSWVVRLQAARTLGRIGAMEDIPLLAALLQDPVWWVRYRAAQALAMLARGDIQKLSRLREETKDRFAQDALGMVMAEQAAK
jgi:HEAT repeats